jgi:chemotaxis protein CheX
LEGELRVDELDASESQQIPDDIRANLLEQLVVSAVSTLAEMAQISAFARGFSVTSSVREFGDHFILMALKPIPNDFLMLCIPKQAAETIARGMLAESHIDPDRSLMLDAMGELVNVIAGQAKALLSETPYHFSFATPKLLDEPTLAAWLENATTHWAIWMSSDAGDFHLLLRLTRGQSAA